MILLLFYITVYLVCGWILSHYIVVGIEWLVSNHDTDLLPGYELKPKVIKYYQFGNIDTQKYLEVGRDITKNNILTGDTIRLIDINTLEDMGSYLVRSTTNKKGIFIYCKPFNKQNYVKRRINYIKE